MATYKVTDPATGRKIKLTGDAPPSEDVIREAFSSLPPPPSPPQQQKPSFMQNLSAVTQGALSPNEFSPSSMLQKIPAMASQVAHKGGTLAAEDLASRGMDPYTSAGVGTLMSMGPDAMLAGINPMAGAPQTVPKMAIPAQRRALGYAYPELATDFGRGQAARAAKISLELGMTTPTGNPKILHGMASDLKAKSGYKLGKLRESVGPQSIKPILNAIDDYKEIRLRGAEGGEWDAIANKIKSAKDTVSGIVPKGSTSDKVSLKRIAEAKKEISKTVNYLSENVSQAEKKLLAGVIEKASEKSLAAAGGDIKAYKELKKIYGAAKSMLKGLNKEVGKQEGNMAISLPSLVAGASGAPGTALKIGGAELIKRRGAGALAHQLMRAANLPQNFGVPLSTAVSLASRKKSKK